ncbi:hypothetical protein ONZ45_g124 [Pleurotus djamor]|nr:hypothetical protein ONZ45_g124 [Pleurotus djamor]
MYSNYPYPGPSAQYYDRPGQPSRQYRPSTAPGQFPVPAHYAQPAPPPPPPQIPPHPGALRPGYAPSTTHRSDLFFSQPANPHQPPARPSYPAGYGPQRRDQYVRPPLHPSQQNYFASPSHHVAPPRPPTAPPHAPPIPPKPSYQHGYFPDEKVPYSAPAVPAPPALRHHSAPPPPREEQEQRDHNADDLALALALSQSESLQKSAEKDKLAYEEESELTRALEESMRLSQSTTSIPSSSQFAGPSKEKLFRAHSYTPGQTIYPLSSPLMPPSIPEVPSPIEDMRFMDEKRFIPSASNHSFQYGPRVDTSGDEEFARRLDKEVDPPPAASPAFVQDTSSHAGPSRTPITSASLEDDEAFARRLEEELNASSRITHQASSAEKTRLSSLERVTDDEAYARKLAEEEQKVVVNQSSSSSDNVPGSSKHLEILPSPGHEPILPTYDDVFGVADGGPSKPSIKHSPSSASDSGHPLPEIKSSSSGEDTYNSFPVSHPPMVRSTSSLAVPGRSTLDALDPSPASPHLIPSDPHDETSPIVGSRRPSVSATAASLSPTLSPSSTEPIPTSPSLKQDNDSVQNGNATVPQLQPPLNANHFVDAGLLKGVSIGFLPPSITQRLTPMQGTFPNIINLPYGRSPPLHLQAPDWRTLLKLMARLSGTRVEPTVEGMAIAKHTMHLRIIVQFVKPHHSAPTWSVVLWFKIDHPIPPNTPNSHKLSGNDVNALPYTFTLGSIPTLLHDADSPVSKYYVIPSTDSLPFPALPVKFPDLAMYLQAALEESRRVLLILQTKIGIVELAVG